MQALQTVERGLVRLAVLHLAHDGALALHIGVCTSRVRSRSIGRRWRRISSCDELRELLDEGGMEIYLMR